jgi:VIT family.
MKRSHKAGVGFGITSGIITPLGLLVGLYSGTQSAAIIIGGILTIAIADAFSDAAGIHVAKEAVHEYSTREVWEATIATFVTKIIFGSMFVIPFLVFKVNMAVLFSVVGGISLLGILSYFIAKSRKENPWWAIGEHTVLTTTVVIITYFVPSFLQTFLS